MKEITEGGELSQQVFCSRDGWVDPVEVGRRHRCPTCGLWLGKPGEHLAGAELPRSSRRTPASPAAAMGTTPRSLADRIRRLELYGDLESVMVGLNELPREARGLPETCSARRLAEAGLRALEAELPTEEAEALRKRARWLAERCVQFAPLFRSVLEMSRTSDEIRLEVDGLKTQRERLTRRIATLQEEEAVVEERRRSRKGVWFPGICIYCGERVDVPIHEGSPPHEDVRYAVNDYMHHGSLDGSPPCRPMREMEAGTIDPRTFQAKGRPLFHHGKLQSVLILT